MLPETPIAGSVSAWDDGMGARKETRVLAAQAARKTLRRRRLIFFMGDDLSRSLFQLGTAPKGAQRTKTPVRPHGRAQPVGWSIRCQLAGNGFTGPSTRLRDPSYPELVKRTPCFARYRRTEGSGSCGGGAQTGFEAAPSGVRCVAGLPKVSHQSCVVLLTRPPTRQLAPMAGHSELVSQSHCPTWEHGGEASPPGDVFRAIVPRAAPTDNER